MNLTEFWYQRKFWIYSLIPFAFLYQSIISIRKLLYKKGYKKIQEFDIPIIVVGNLTVGGTGKTPLVIWLANYLQNAGFKPGIVSRGYKGKCKNYPCVVTAESKVNEVGDEALIMARQTDCPIVVSPQRIDAVKKLIEIGPCNIVLSDDGLQHYAMGRSLEFVVIDGERWFGNERLLPAGPLREPIKRLAEVDLVFINAGAKTQVAYQQKIRDLEKIIDKEKILVINMLGDTSVNIKNPNQKMKLFELANKKVHAVAGIGNPKRFFTLLENFKIDFISHVFSDHHKFTKRNLDFGDDMLVLMTEKDAVKCTEFAKENWWYVPVKVNINLQFQKQLLHCFKAY